MVMVIDDLDKRILQYLSIGTSSYEELARMCNVTRNTVYRRIASLENRGIIKNTIKCSINLDQLDITPICVGATVALADQDKAFNLLASNSSVRLLWRTYGDHNITFVVFCPKGSEGEIIHGIRALLEDLNASDICVSVGFVWEKMDMTPFGDQPEVEMLANPVLESRH